MKPDDSTKNGLDAIPAEKKTDVARASGPPAWLGPALLEARCKDLANAGHRLAKCAECGHLLYEVEGVFIHEDSRAPLHVGVPIEVFDPAAEKAAEANREFREWAHGDGANVCGMAPALTLRERVARFIFPRRTVGEIPVEAMSPAVKWGSGDVMTTHVWGDVSFWDLLRLIFSRRLLIEVKTATELMPGHSVSRAVISVLPPQFLEPGPSGNWSPEDERDLFDTIAGMETEIVETGFVGRPVNRSLKCPHCGHFGPVDFECSHETCQNCGMAVDEPPVVDPPNDGKMSPRELRAIREQYRILEPGETKQEGDEYSADGGETWRPTCATGGEVAPNSLLYRRPVQGGIGFFEAAQNARHLAPMGAVWKPTPPNTACAACGELIVNEACRCGIRGPNGPGPHPDGAPGTDMRELEPGEIIETGDRLGNGELVDLWSIGKPAGTVKLPIFRGVPLGEPAGVEGEEGRPE